MNKKVIFSMFEKGYSCAQIIFSTYGPSFGIDKELALKTSYGFGGGMARMGKICGAVTGDYMVLGLKHGKLKTNNEVEPNYETYQKIEEFVKEFRNRNQNINCRDLIGVNISTPEGRQKAIDDNIFTTVCPKLILDVAEILEQLL
ncbi:MAG: C-GCAxxG-C-C family protein [Promethearchaeota archaeon]